ncbi:YbhB/YbcL family Raf kinase inhibitor-like protein [Acidobacteriota bacterium]
MTGFQLMSEAFEHEGHMPDLYTCKGENISPPLNWTDPLEGTKSFALVAVDPDAIIMTFTHWVMCNIPADKRELSEAVPHQEEFEDGMIQGRNGMRQNKYLGPCPPWGKHRYIFTIYALDVILDADAKLNKKRLLRAMKGHILAHTELMGYYSKK